MWQTYCLCFICQASLLRLDNSRSGQLYISIFPKVSVMKKISFMLILSVIIAGCSAPSLQRVLSKLKYHKNPIDESEYWDNWRTRTFGVDDYFEEYEINSYLTCFKKDGGYFIRMNTQSGANSILSKYEVENDNLSSAAFIGLGEYKGRGAYVYEGDNDAHLDIYEKNLTKEEIHILSEMAKTPGTKFTPVTEDNKKFTSRRLTDTERVQIQAILMTCKFM